MDDRGLLPEGKTAASWSDGPHKLPGWTRLCHSDLTNGGSPLNWDWSMEEVRALAQRAKRVRIQNKADPDEAVVSKPDAYPIENIRSGNPIGFGRGLDETQVCAFWESQQLPLLDRLLHVSDCWMDHGHKDEVSHLETNVYWAACNGQGLHWHGLVHGGHLHPTCTWNNRADTDLELYVDAEPEPSAVHGEAFVHVVVRDLAGNEVASLQVPSHEAIGRLKKRLLGCCAFSVHTQRLLHPSVDGALEDGLHLRELPHPVELQLVRLPLDPHLGTHLGNPAWVGDLRGVEQMLRNCADPSVPNPEGMTPLMLASVGGHMQVVRSLCAAGADTNKATPAGETPFWIAAATGRVEVARFLSDAGADRGVPLAANGAAPLHMAAHNGHHEVVLLLIDADEDLDRPMVDGSTALQMAAQGGHEIVVRCLCEAGADKDRANNDGWNALQLAVYGGQLEVVRYLCLSGADKAKPFRDGSTPLMMAATVGQIDILEFLCLSGGDKDKPRSDGAAPLHMAAKLGNLDVVRCLIEARADVEQAPATGMTPLFVAAASGHTLVARQLLDARASAEQRLEANGRTPLLVATVAGHVELVRLLCDRGVVINAPQVDGRTPLAMASEAGDLGVVQLLCKRGADKDLPDNNGWTALLLAESMQRPDVARWLRDRGAAGSPPRGSKFSVDNSRLKQASPGVGFRLSKELQDRAGDALYAAWGAIVIGEDGGDGWLRVGKRYLPMALHGVPVLVPVVQGE